MAPDPKNWDYEDHPAHHDVLPERARELLVCLRAGLIVGLEVCKDSRPQHAFFFKGLTPPGHDYFAGHYRGENYPALRRYEVGIPGDPRVGVHSSLVCNAMNYFSTEVVNHVSVLRSADELPAAQLSREFHLIYTVRVACKFFVEFLRVHPYANGNGHMGRFFIFGFLGIFGIWPKRWPLNDRPPDPPYSDLIANYRDNKCEPLEMFVLRCVIG